MSCQCSCNGMTTFGWKRKAVHLQETTSSRSAFPDDDDSTIDESRPTGHRQCQLSREEQLEKAKQLKEAGSEAAENAQFGEALGRWDSALKFTPDDATLHEMKAQVLLLMDKVFPAITEASRAVAIQPLWYRGHQTLGRCQLAFGDVHMAIKSFCRALHQQPDDKELREEDLLDAVSLLTKLTTEPLRPDEQMSIG